MAYKYNERTGEFEDIPQASAQRKTAPATGHQPSRTSGSDSFLESLGGIIVGVLPYAIGILLAVTCS